jgi:IclR family pca regulon transcriptional regulator
MKANDPRHQRNFLKTLDRGLRVLSTFTPQTPALTLTELSKKLSLDPGTTFRFAYTLEHLGYLRRDPHTGAYSLTARVLEMARAVHRQDDLRASALPFMAALSSETGETVSLAVRDGAEIVVLEQVQSPKPVTVRRALGDRQPVYCTAQGKVLLAYASPFEQAQVLDKLKLKAYGPRTLTDRAALEADLRRTRQRGYALNNDEMNAGLRAVAAPICSGPDRAILDRAIPDRAIPDRVIAALSVDVPTVRMTLADLQERVAERVMKTAAEISRVLGAPE